MSNKKKLIELGYTIVKYYPLEGMFMMQRPNNGFCSTFKSFSEAMKYYTLFPTYNENIKEL